MVVGKGEAGGEDRTLAGGGGVPSASDTGERSFFGGPVCSLHKSSAVFLGELSCFLGCSPWGISPGPAWDSSQVSGAEIQKDQKPAEAGLPGGSPQNTSHELLPPAPQAQPFLDFLLPLPKSRQPSHRFCLPQRAPHRQMSRQGAEEGGLGAHVGHWAPVGSPLAPVPPGPHPQPSDGPCSAGHPEPLPCAFAVYHAQHVSCSPRRGKDKR